MTPEDADRAKLMRASDTDRDRVAEILRDAAGEGRITLDELDERLDLVYRSRTYADLEPITADLPTGRERVFDLAARPPVDAPDAERTLELLAKAGSISRKGQWRVPERVVVKNPYGDIRLDFREAIFLTGVVELDMTANWGQARLLLPDGATAEIMVDTSWYGTVDSRVPEIPAPPAPHLRITGNFKGGTLKVRYRGRIDDWLS